MEKRRGKSEQRGLATFTTVSYPSFLSPDHPNMTSSTVMREIGNGFGVALRHPTRLMQRWIQRAHPGAQLPMLEIGCADGVASLRALSRGAAVIANDINTDMLEEMRSRAAAGNAHAQNQDEPHMREQRQGSLASVQSAAMPLASSAPSALTLLPGTFPAVLSQLPTGSVGDTLSSNVIHFLSPDALRAALSELRRVMAPSATLFLECDSPHMNTALRWPYLLRRALCATHPGFFIFGNRVAAEDATAFPLPRSALPPRLSAMRHYHMLEPAFLQQCLQEAGFEVQRCELTPPSDADPLGLALDGREVLEAEAVVA